MKFVIVVFWFIAMCKKKGNRIMANLHSQHDLHCITTLVSIIIILTADERLAWQRAGRQKQVHHTKQPSLWHNATQWRKGEPVEQCDSGLCGGRGGKNWLHVARWRKTGWCNSSWVGFELQAPLHISTGPSPNRRHHHCHHHLHHILIVVALFAPPCTSQLVD